MKTAVTLSALALCAANSMGQISHWLPISDLPLSNLEARHLSGPPGLGGVCVWDMDGPGPLPKQLVVGGSLALTIPNASALAYLDDDGWHGIAGAPFTSGVYSLGVYAAPGQTSEDLYVGLSGAGVYRYDGITWTHVASSGSTYEFDVLDLDGPGPQPPMLYFGSSRGVYQFDGTTVTQLTGANAPTTCKSVFGWDPDGDGPLPQVLLASGLNPSTLQMWDGVAWTVLTTTYKIAAPAGNAIQRIAEFDFDGDGPNPPELVMSGGFGEIGTTTNHTGPVAVYRNGAWVGVGIQSGVVNDFVTFDPDGSGPMQPWLVVTGNFTLADGTSTKIAYFSGGAWHVFPPYWNGEGTTLLVTNEAPFSDSPQLNVGGIASRPVFGRFAVSGGPSGVVFNPDNVSRPAGTTAHVGVVPSGDELTFRWYKDDVALNDGLTGAGSTLSGVYGPRLTITSLTASDVGQYRVEIGNAFGVVTSSTARVAIGCPADFNADNGVDMFDYLDFVDAFATQRPSADFNNDDVIDFFDYLDFVQTFAGEC